MAITSVMFHRGPVELVAPIVPQVPQVGQDSHRQFVDLAFLSVERYGYARSRHGLCDGVGKSSDFVVGPVREAGKCRGSHTGVGFVAQFGGEDPRAPNCLCLGYAMNPVLVAEHPLGLDGFDDFVPDELVKTTCAKGGIVPGHFSAACSCILCNACQRDHTGVPGTAKREEEKCRASNAGIIHSVGATRNFPLTHLRSGYPCDRNAVRGVGGRTAGIHRVETILPMGVKEGLWRSTACIWESCDLAAYVC